MTSTSVTKVGGVVIVTQVIPQDENAIQLQTPPVAAQAPPPVADSFLPTMKTTPPARKTPPTVPTKVDEMTATFLRGQPHGLGVVQILIGLLCILFSLSAAYHPFLLLHAPFCLAVSFVISGAVSLAAVGRTSASLVWNSLVWNVISTIMGLVGVAYLCWLLADRPPSERFCDSGTWGGIVPTRSEISSCADKLWLLDVCLYGPLGLLLVLMVLQVCVAVTLSVFSGLSISRCHHHSPFTANGGDNSNPLLSDSQDSDVGLLDSDGEEASRLPPN
ncbi:high affinity immunoglobulin epsilon receptor subunit beta [Antennarius striatus]|uniref:high affinity immunoglobulin epsilon receptor subunit beta n=1 Tax=Antennarius striatus TaxID=241820 RepID=UPI0035B36C2E